MIWKLPCGVANPFNALRSPPALSQISLYQYYARHWAEEWWSVIPDPFCPRWCLRSALRPPTTMIIHRWFAKPTIFSRQECGEWWYEMNEQNYKLMKRRDWKVVNVDGMKLGKREIPKKTPKNLEIAHHNCPPGNTDTRTLNSSRVGRKYNRERKT